MHEVPGRCPVCGEGLQVTRLRCPACETAIEGAFSLARLGRLSAEQLAFLEVFVKNRGIIRDVERELGISYPTVRNRLDDLIRAMGFEVKDEAAPGQDEERERRRHILEQVGKGEITAEQAARLLRR